MGVSVAVRSSLAGVLPARSSLPPALRCLQPSEAAVASVKTSATMVRCASP
jgi:hypothetical protein